MLYGRLFVCRPFLRSLTLLVLSASAACTTLEIQSPYQGRALSLADAQAACTESGRYGQWYLLFGVAPVLRSSPAELFPRPDDAYRVRTEYDWLDAAISLIGGSFLSLHKNTLVVERCAAQGAPAETAAPPETAPAESSAPETAPAPVTDPAPTSTPEAAPEAAPISAP